MIREMFNMDEKLVEEIRKMPHNLENIPKITQKIIKDLKTKEFPIPIIKIMKELNFLVGQQELEENLSGYIVINDKVNQMFGKEKMICVNSKDNVGHQRFTIAHELAHYLFDYNSEMALDFYNTYRTTETEDEKERRANQFAANLLMPENEFKKQYRKFGINEEGIMKLQEYFQTSRRAVDRRIIELGLN